MTSTVGMVLALAGKRHRHRQKAGSELPSGTMNRAPPWPYPVGVGRYLKMYTLHWTPGN